MLLQGLFVPLTTPFYPDGRLNLPKLEHNVARYSKTPVAGLTVLGPGGEPSLLSDDETRQALDSALKASAAEKVMLAGVSRDSVIGTAELAEFAFRAGYDAVLVGTPGLLAPEQRKERLTFFQAVADRSPLPVVLSSSDAAPLGIEEIAMLARHPHVIGMVESHATAQRLGEISAATADIEREATVTIVFEAVTRRMLADREPVETGTRIISLQALSQGGTVLATEPAKPALKTRVRTVGFQVMGGGSGNILEALQAGAAGVLPSFAACAPQACYEVLAAWKDGDFSLAEEKQARVSSASGVVEGAAGGMRYACDLNGYYGGRPRLPLLFATEQERTRIDAVMRGVRN